MTGTGEESVPRGWDVYPDVDAGVMRRWSTGEIVDGYSAPLVWVTVKGRSRLRRMFDRLLKGATA